MLQNIFVNLANVVHVGVTGRDVKLMFVISA